MVEYKSIDIVQISIRDQAHIFLITKNNKNRY